MAINYFSTPSNEPRLADIRGKTVENVSYQNGCLTLRFSDGTMVMAGQQCRLEGRDLVVEDILEVVPGDAGAKKLKATEAEFDSMIFSIRPGTVILGKLPEDGAKASVTLAHETDKPTNCPNHFPSPISGRCYDCGQP